jgi:hypothetical protein
MGNEPNEGAAPFLVEWLAAHKAGDLAALRQRHPDEGAILSASRTLGAADATKAPKPKLSPSKRAALVDILRTSVADVGRSLDRIGGHMRDALARIARIRLFSAVVSAIAGGLTAILALSLAAGIVQAISAVIGMVAALAVIFADHIERNPEGARANNAETYAKLLELRSKVDGIAAQIARDGVLPIPDDALLAMVKELDAAAATLSRWDKL